MAFEMRTKGAAMKMYVNKRLTRQKVETIAECVSYKIAIQIIKKLQRFNSNAHYYMSTIPSKSWDGQDYIWDELVNVLVRR